MNPRRRRLGFILSTLGVLAALVLPLSTEAAVPLPARPVLMALTVAAALLFAVAAWTRGSWVLVAGFAGVLFGATTTLALLRDPGIAGSAAAGFWTTVLAVWLSAALCVVQLAAIRPRNEALRRALGLAIPLLFGAAVFYLWEAVSYTHLTLPTIYSV